MSQFAHSSSDLCSCSAHSHNALQIPAGFASVGILLFLFY